MTLNLGIIRTDGGTQTRAALDQDVINQYADDMLNEVTFPPIVVFHDGKEYWCADGFHRIGASKKAGFTEIDAEIKQGTRRDAILYSVGANTTHGLRRTNADKRRAVTLLLEDNEWKKWSDRKIAEKCGVGNRMVSDMRRSLCPDHSEKTYTTKHGTTATMNTANIGRKPEPVPDEDISDYEEEVSDEDSEKEAPAGRSVEPSNDSIIVDVDYVTELVDEMYGTIVRRFRKLNNKQYNRAVNHLIKLLQKFER